MAPSLRRSNGILAVALLLAAAVSCYRAAAESSITQAELADRIAAERAPLILDVRTQSEFSTGHIPGAVNIPHTELAGRLGELGGGSDREIVVYCEGGSRAMAAASELQRAGFSSVLLLQGDMSAWRKSQRFCVGC
jgi:rhodanese-related sulfurtransferase